MNVVLPVVIPLATAAVLLALWNLPRIQRAIALLGSVAHVLAAINLTASVCTKGPQSAAIGNWPAPFGIEFRADLLSTILVLLGSVIGAAINVYASESIDRPRKDFGFHTLLFALLAGASGAFVTADLFNLFVWFECILLSSFVLLALGGENKQIRGALNYIVPNLFSSMLFLCGLGLIYGMTGTLNMQDLAVQLQTAPPNLVDAVSVLFLVAFALKAAVFPFFGWLPTSYHTPPIAITALFAGLLTKVGVYALFRYFTFVRPLQPGPLTDALVWLSVLTMVVAIIAACAANDLKKVLAYNIVSHVGTMTAALALNTKLGVQSGIFYMAHHILTITALFLVVGIIERHFKTTDINKLGDGNKVCPHAGTLFFLLSLALAGTPPLSGFWPKIGVLQAVLQAERQEIALATLFVALLTLYSLIRAYINVFWKPQSDQDRPISEPKNKRMLVKYAPALVLTVAVVAIGLLPAVPAQTAKTAADQIWEEDLKVLLWNALLAMVWCLLQGSSNLGNILAGFILGFAVLALLDQTNINKRKFDLLRLPRILGLVAYFVWELLVANARLAADLLTPGISIDPAIVPMPLDAETDAEITLVAALITLTPGTLSMDVSPDRKTLYVHAIYAADPEAVVKSLKNGFEKRVLEVLR